MRYFLPPHEDPVPGTIHGVTPVGATLRPDPHEEDLGALAEGRLVRIVHMPRADGPGYLSRWRGEPGVAPTPLATPEGAVAWERSRADRLLAGVSRLQRLAMVETDSEAIALHWSAPLPLQRGDQPAWESALERLGAPAPARIHPPPDGEGWIA